MKIDRTSSRANGHQRIALFVSCLFLAGTLLGAPRLGFAQTPILPTNVLGEILPPAPGTFNQPQNVAYAAGKIYVSDVSGYVRAFNVSTGALVGSYTDPNLQPYGVAVDKSGLIYAADPFRNEVVIWNQSGAKVGSFAGRTDYQRYGAKGLAINEKRNEIWVANLDNSMIEVHDKTAPYAFKKKLQYFYANNGSGLQRYSLRTPTYLTFLPGGDLLVVDTLGSGVFRFRADFKAGAEPAAVAAIVVDFASFKATGISADDQGHVYVSMTNEGTIHVYDSYLRFMYYLGQGTEPFWFNMLYGLASYTNRSTVTLWAVAGGAVKTLRPIW